MRNIIIINAIDIDFPRGINFNYAYDAHIHIRYKAIFGLGF